MIPMRFQRGNIWLKSGWEKSPLSPFAKGGLGGIFRLGPSPVLYFFERNLVSGDDLTAGLVYNRLKSESAVSE